MLKCVHWSYDTNLFHKIFDGPLKSELSCTGIVFFIDQQENKDNFKLSEICKINVIFWVLWKLFCKQVK